MYLMHKNDIVAKIDIYDNKVIGVSDIYREDLLPIGLNGDISFVDQNICTWAQQRVIPYGRVNITQIESALGSVEELTMKSMGLSLTDCYWYADEEQVNNFRWENINFHDNGFICDLLLLKQQLLEQCHRSPDYTTNGVLDKFWFYENGVAYLVKSGYIPGVIHEPVLAANEVAASRIGRQLGIPCVEYTKVMMYDEPFCICKCFSQRNEDIVSAQSIAYQLDTDDEKSIRRYFKDSGFQKELDQMAVFHVLIHNQDAHLNNFALGMDADTGRYTRFIPLYDNGNSLGWNGISRATSKDMKPFESDPREYLNQVQTYGQLPELSVLESIIRDVYQDFQISEAQTQIALDTIREGFEMVSDRMQQLQQELEPEEIGAEENR